VEAVFDKGVQELLEEIEKHRLFLAESGGTGTLDRRRGKVREELAEMVKNRIVQEVFDHLRGSGEFEEAVDSVVERKTDPYTACDRLVLPRLCLSGGWEP